MLATLLKSTSLTVLILGAGALAADSATAGSHQSSSHKAHKHHAGHGASQALVNDGPGTPYGFHQDPAPFRLGARRFRHRQAEAVQETVDIDAATSGGYYGFPGDSVYGYGGRGSRGVFSGADGYGSPYFAGFYGPATGTDYGPFGRAYDDED